MATNSKQESLLYITPYYKTGGNGASIRSEYFVQEISKYALINLISVNETFFKLRRGESGKLKRLFYEFIWGMEVLFRSLLYKKNKVLISSPPFFSMLIMATFCKLFRIKYYLDIRDLYPEVFSMSGLVSECSKVFRLISSYTSFLYDGAEHVFFATQGIMELSGIERNSSVIWNGYCPKRFFYEQKHGEDFTIVFHGTLGKFQRSDLLVALSEKIEKANLRIKMVVVGKGEGESLFNDCSGVIRYYGGLEVDNVAEIVRASHLGISLRTDDNISKTAFPVKIFEYFGSGLPFVYSPKDSAPSFFPGFRGRGVGVNNDLDEIFETVVDIYNNYSKYAGPVKGATYWSRDSQAKEVARIIFQ